MLLLTHSKAFFRRAIIGMALLAMIVLLTHPVVAATDSSAAASSIDPEQLPPFMKPELLAHIVAMDMTDTQKATFRSALGTCVSSLPGIIQKEIRRGGTDIPKRVQRAVNRKFNAFDKSVRKTLNEDQMAHWSDYFEGFKTAMSEAYLSR